MTELHQDQKADELSLPQSGLYFNDGQIVRRDSAGASIAKFDCPSGDIIGCRRSIDWGLVTVVSILGLIIFAVFSYGVPSPWNFIIALPIGGIGLLFFLSGAIETEVILKSDSGTVFIPIMDPAADAKAFVLSVKERIRIRNAEH